MVLKANHGSQRVVVAVDDLAERLGVRIGMPVTKAQILVPDLMLMDADPHADEQALQVLAEWLIRFTPVVAPDLPDGLVLDTTGADHLKGGEAQMADTLIQRLETENITAHVAIADTWGTAWAMARYSRRQVSIVPAGTRPPPILDLPIAALRLPVETVERMRKVGLDTVRDVASQPSAPLTKRYGLELGRRLNQALGFASDPITRVLPAGVIQVERAFSLEPISAPETIARYTMMLCAQLAVALADALKGARVVDLLFQRVDGHMEVVRVGTSAPLREPDRLFRLLQEKIQKVDPGFGIERMAMTATQAEPMESAQRNSIIIEEAKPDITSLVEVFSNRLGQNAVYKLAPVASSMPERCVRRAGPTESLKDLSWPAHWPRPTRLLPRPEPIEVTALMPDHPPALITWRQQRIRIKMADGPERVRGEFWKYASEDRLVRDYYVLVDGNGKRLWVFREGDGQHLDSGSGKWFLHGVFG